MNNKKESTMNNHLVFFALLLTAVLYSMRNMATPSIEQVNQLGGDVFTPVGAEKQANKTGDIPAWTGGLTQPPAGWKSPDKLITPFPDDQPIDVINNDTYQKFAGHLTPGQIKLLQLYPTTYHMPIYKTRRTAAYPERVYQDIKTKALQSKLVDAGNGLEKFTSNVPFPFPENGVEVIWNHIVRFRGTNSIKRTYSQIAVQRNGDFRPVIFQEFASWGRELYGEDTQVVMLFWQNILAPSRLEGEKILVHETLNQQMSPRQVWLYSPGQRRVRRAPSIAYDDVAFASDGLRTADDVDLYNGSPDRYSWTLVGKKEIYIPYNSYQILDGSLKYKDVVKQGHLAPEFLRYELHRVWVVDAQLKSDKRHVYKRRTFYIDEDTWQIALVDHYDNHDQLWKFKEAHPLMHYSQAVPWLAAEVIYDLYSGRYLVVGLDNELTGYQYDWTYRAGSKDYTPSALRRSANH